MCRGVNMFLRALVSTSSTIPCPFSVPPLQYTPLATMSRITPSFALFLPPLLSFAVYLCAIARQRVRQGVMDLVRV
ncbi:MAG: hypothetical protein JOS17DRAFT_120272 [Linnemannia elongata]|nr:MAG: hypothetical protein JOS17DRAFT_120272 [Linnemannia elongata]